MLCSVMHRLSTVTLIENGDICMISHRDRPVLVPEDVWAIIHTACMDLYKYFYIRDCVLNNQGQPDNFELRTIQL